MHLGVIPVLWEDNLPQVAIEFVANGIPILTSHLGGAREIANVNEFVFAAGDFGEFAEKISDIVDRRVELKTFWKNEINVCPMKRHVDALYEIYG